MKSRFGMVTKEHYTLSELEKAFKNKGLLYIYAGNGDLDSIHLAVDAEIALNEAEPTDLQRKTLDIVWRQGKTLVEAGKELGVSPQAVKFNVNLLRVKLKRVLDRWETLDEY